MRNQAILKGFEAYDYEYAAVEQKATPQTVFELINDSVSAAEAETAAKMGVPSLEYGPLDWDANRTVEFCNDYDAFINDVDFKLDVFGVLKLDMENFWAGLERNKDKRARFGENRSARILNKVETDGGSSVYQFGNNKVTFGYLANNMTYDGQYAYVLTSERAGGAARRCFRTTGNYPKELDVVSGKLTRWGKIVAKVAASGETAIGAWAVLEENDAKVFYGELKKHNWLSASDKQLLKSVKRTAGGLTFDLYKESLEDRLKEIEAELEVADQTVDLSLEFEEIEDKLLSYDEEHNSEAAVSLFEDYDNFDYYKDKYYYENRPKTNGQ